MERRARAAVGQGRLRGRLEAHLPGRRARLPHEYCLPLDGEPSLQVKGSTRSCFTTVSTCGCRSAQRPIGSKITNEIIESEAAMIDLAIGTTATQAVEGSD